MDAQSHTHRGKKFVVFKMLGDPKVTQNKLLLRQWWEIA